MEYKPLNNCNKTMKVRLARKILKSYNKMPLSEKNSTQWLCRYSKYQVGQALNTLLKRVIKLKTNSDEQK